MRKTLLSISVLLLWSSMAVATEVWSGNGQGTQDAPYEIWSVDLLHEVHNFDGVQGKYFRLEIDLDLTDYLEGLSWEPIGTKDAPFMGAFLGNGHTITGMAINSTSDYQGFFGYIDGATIRDLTIEGSVKGGDFVGGIVGCSSASFANAISNCSFTGDVTSTKYTVGGIAGEFAGNIDNVEHVGDVKGAGTVGGIVGRHYGGRLTYATATGSVTATAEGSYYAGGIAGRSYVNITSSHSYGDVKGYRCVGGLLGAGEQGSNLSDCSAVGQVTGIDSTGGLVGFMENGTISLVSADGTVSGGQYTGGLVGYCGASLANGTHSGGGVSGTSYVGGLVGKCFGSVSYCRHSGGNLSGTDCVGGAVGELSSGSVTNSYIYADLTGNDNVGGIVGCYLLSNGNSPQIASSGYFGNISARSCVGGILGQVSYNSDFATTDVTIPTELHIYQTYGKTDSEDCTYEEKVIPANNTVTISNCAAVGNVYGMSTYIGGILGKGFGGELLVTEENSFYPNLYKSDHKINERKIDGVWFPCWCYYYDGKFYNSGLPYSSAYPNANRHAHPYYTYYYTATTTILTDNYFSGNLKGTDNIGGVVGYMHGGDVLRNYSYAAIEGVSKVGGIVGYMEADLTNIQGVISSNVELNSTITVSSAAGGKIYGSASGSNLSVPTTGNSINKALNTTVLVINGITQATDNDAQNGTLQTQRQLLRSTSYSGLGWNFDGGREWTSEETVSYPYKQWQTAPPTIKNGAVSGSSSIGGTCQDDGTVFVTIDGNSTVYEAVCSGGSWSLDGLPPLKSGILIRAWSKSPSKEQSYHTATNAGFPGSGTEADPWLIYDAYDLKGMAKAGFYKMMNDVDLTEWIAANSSTIGWPGIGSAGDGAIVFDGDGRRVTGLWCNTVTSQNGLFSYLQNATVKNLTVEVAEGRQVKGNANTAVLAGQLKGCTVTNVTVKGDVVGNGNVAALIASSSGNTISQCHVDGCTITTGGTHSSVGGMLGLSQDDNISDCDVSATVTPASSDADGCDGGLAGRLIHGTVTRCTFSGTVSSSAIGARVGGMAGLAQNSQLMRCAVNATVTAAGSNSYVGGLVGYSSESTTVSQCFTEGTVKASGSKTNAAGIAGNTDATCPVDNCVCTADITGTGYVGGIVGYALGSITNCVATGSLLNSSNDGRAGGIVGFIEERAAVVKGCGGINKRIETCSNQWGFRIIGGTGSNISRPEVTDNYGWDEMPILRNNARKTVTDDPYEGTAKTTGELQQQSTYETLGWDFGDVWAMDGETLLPMLKWLSASEQPQNLDLADIADGDYYLKNVETGLFLGQGNAWGMRAVLDNTGLPAHVEKQGDGSYTITFTRGSANLKQLFRADAESVYVDYAGQDSGCPYWTITNTATAGYYRIQTLVGHALYGQAVYSGTYLGNNPGKEAFDQNGNPLGVYNDVDGNVTEDMNITWTLVPAGELSTALQRSQIQALISLAWTLGVNTAEAEAAVNNGDTDFAQMENAISNLRSAIEQRLSYGVDGSMVPLDLTALIKNPSFVEDDAEGWEGNEPLFQHFNNAEFFESTFDIHQTLSGLPNGNYIIEVKGFHRPGYNGNVYADYRQGVDNSRAQLYANDAAITLVNQASCALDDSSFGGEEVSFGEQTQWVPNSMSDARQWFDAGYYGNSLYVTVYDGTLTLGIRLDESVAKGWVIFDDFRLTYLGLGDQPQPEVEVTDISQLANAIYIEPVTTQAGTDVQLEVRLKNAEKATSYGFELVLPEGMAIDVDDEGCFDDAVIQSGRHNSHTVTTNLLSNGAYKVAVASLKSKSLSDNDGVVLTILTHVSPAMQGGAYPIRIVNPLLVSSDGSKPVITSTQTRLTIEDYMKGDADADGVVDLADAVKIINYYVGKPVGTFVEKAADVDGDSEIDLADAVKVIGYYVGKIPSLSRQNADVAMASRSTMREAVAGQNALTVAPVALTQNGGDMKVKLTLGEENVYTSYQFRIETPEGVSYVVDDDDDVECILGMGHSATHEATAHWNALTRVLGLGVISHKSALLEGNTVELSIPLAATAAENGSAYELKITGITFIRQSGEKDKLDDVTATVTVGAAGIKGDVDGNSIVDMSDVTALMSLIATGTPAANADVNGDGKVDVADVIALLSYISR